MVNRFKRKTLVLHPGQHKTGTSAIQRYLYEQFDHPDVAYLHADRANASLWMLRAFKQDIAEHPSFQHLKLTDASVSTTREKARNKLARTIATHADKPTHILSAEAIATFTQQELQDLLVFFKTFYAHIHVHIYFRPLKSRMESAFQEKLKRRFSAVYDKYYLDYMSDVSLFDSVFGRDSVFVHKYDRSRFESGSVVVDFLDRLGVQGSCVDSGVANAGMSMDAVRYMYIYRQFYPQRDAGDAARIAMLSELQGRSFRFHSELYRQLLVTAPSSVAPFEERAGFSIEEDLMACDDYGVKCEEDLYQLSDDSMQWLRAKAGVDIPSVFSLEDIAVALRCLDFAGNAVS